MGFGDMFGGKQGAGQALGALLGAPFGAPGMMIGSQLGGAIGGGLDAGDEQSRLEKMGFLQGPDGSWIARPGTAANPGYPSIPGLGQGAEPYQVHTKGGSAGAGAMGGGLGGMDLSALMSTSGMGGGAQDAMSNPNLRTRQGMINDPAYQWAMGRGPNPGMGPY